MAPTLVIGFSSVISEPQVQALNPVLKTSEHVSRRFDTKYTSRRHTTAPLMLITRDTAAAEQSGFSSIFPLAQTAEDITLNHTPSVTDSMR